MAIEFVYKQVTPEGLWTSEPFTAETERHVAQGVIAGFLIGQTRWAETLDGRFLYGLTARGLDCKGKPAFSWAGASNE